MFVKLLVPQILFQERTALMNAQFPNNFTPMKKFVSMIVQKIKAFIQMKVLISLCVQIHVMLISKI
jgi:hypothetical protein